MEKLPKVVIERAKELFETGDQPTMYYAENKAKHEYIGLLNDIKKIEGDQVDLEPYIQALDSITLDRYFDLLRQFSFYARQK